MNPKYFLHKIGVLIIVFFIPVFIKAQSIDLPPGLSVFNQLEYSYDTKDKLEIFEDWLNIDYTKGIFTAGLRLETYQPNDPNPAVNRGKNRFAEFAYKYIKLDIGKKREGVNLVAGNFYQLFGRGMILKSYEDRNIRIDNNLLGVKVDARYAGFQLIVLTGMPENPNQERKDILHAVDLEYSGIKMFKFGGSFASNQPDVDGVARTRLASARLEASVWNFDFYGEYGIKQNDDIKENIYNGGRDIAGKAFYGNLNFYYGPFSLVGEYKYYDDFSFLSNDATVIYNTPPAVIKDYTYSLLNRHPHALNPNNERGFQVEASLNLTEETYFSANFGLTKTLDTKSFFQRRLGTMVDPRTALKEIYVQANHTWNDKFRTIAALGYNEELSSNTKSVTPILENHFHIDEINTLKLVIEHQHVTDRNTDERYYDDVITLEFLHSPTYSVSVVSEMQTKEPEEDRLIRKFWNFIQFGYRLSEQIDLSLLVGSRQAGNICIGGVCRYEPEFRGIELKMLTRLY